MAQFEAVTDLRRIVHFSPQMLNGASQLRQAVSSVVLLVDSLRSSVVKGALICLHELFRAYRKQMDCELDRCAAVCLKKAIDTNGFLSDEADRTLMVMCQSSSESKGLSVMLNLLVDSKAKNPKLRAKCVWCLLQIIQRLGSRLPRHTEAERLIQMLGKLSVDASAEVRHL